MNTYDENKSAMKWKILIKVSINKFAVWDQETKLTQTDYEPYKINQKL